MFNLYQDGLDLDSLRHYCMEHGEERLLKRGEIFEDAGKPSQYVAYVERGCFKYMVNNEEEGKDYCTGFAFEGEFVADYPNCLTGRKSELTIVVTLTLLLCVQALVTLTPSLTMRLSVLPLILMLLVGHMLLIDCIAFLNNKVMVIL